MKFNFERAPEPSDVYWENLSTTAFWRLIRITLTYLVTAIIIGICFGILYGINIGKTEVEKRQDIP
jgi:ABC-type nitrate/sulfonate/bicarbonate transport system permease component